jgi:hypothetical protein
LSLAGQGTTDGNNASPSPTSHKTFTKTINSDYCPTTTTTTIDNFFIAITTLPTTSTGGKVSPFEASK